MAAPTAVFVRPLDNDDNGDGSEGDPYGDLEYALEQTTRDATNGNIFHVKAGTSEFLEFALDIVTDYGTPTIAAPLIFRGYTSAAADGGQGVLDGGGSISIVDLSTLDFVHFIDMRLTNTGSNTIAVLDDKCSFTNCEIDTSSGVGLNLGTAGKVLNCYFHGLTGTYAVDCGIQATVVGDLISSSVTAAGIRTSSASSVITNNIVRLTATNAADGIVYNDDCVIMNNSCFAVAGTGNGFGDGAAGRDQTIVVNNIAEGFSGTGGHGFNNGTSDHVLTMGYNSTFNCATDQKITEIFNDLGNNNFPLAVSPFVDPTNGDFTLTPAARAKVSWPLFNGQHAMRGVLGAVLSNTGGVGRGMPRGSV